MNYMSRCYVPYFGNVPVVVNINGHDLVLVGTSPDVFEETALFGEEALGSQPLIEDQSALIEDQSVVSTDSGLSSGFTRDDSESNRVSTSGDDHEGASFPPKEEEAVRTPVCLKKKREERKLPIDFEVREYDLEALDWSGSDSISPESDQLSDDALIQEIRGIPILGGDDGIPSPESFAGFNEESFLEVQRLEQFAKSLAARSGSGVVFIPAAASLEEIFAELQAQLPWCH